MIFITDFLKTYFSIYALNTCIFFFHIHYKSTGHFRLINSLFQLQKLRDKKLNKNKYIYDKKREFICKFHKIVKMLCKLFACVQVKQSSKCTKYFEQNFCA